jgi:hypothetical protein
VRLDEIDCFVAEEGYVIARANRLEGFVEARLNELESRFGSTLIRVHRSCLAVKSSIAGIETRSAAEHRLLFRDSLEPVPISRRQLGEVRDYLRGQGRAWSAIAGVNMGGPSQRTAARSRGGPRTWATSATRLYQHSGGSRAPSGLSPSTTNSITWQSVSLN